MTRFESARLDRGSQRCALPFENRRDLFEGHGAVADGTAHEPIALVCELRHVVLEMDVADPVRGAAGERHGILADGERIAGVETDAGMRTELFDEVDQLLAADVLVIFDRQHQPGIADTIGLPAERAVRVRDHLVPARAPSSARALEHGRQVEAQDPRAESTRTAHSVTQIFTRRVRKPETADRLEAVEPIAQPSQARVVERRQPAMIQLDRSQPQLADDGDEAVNTERTKIGARSPQTLQAQRIGQAVGVQGEAHFGARGSGLGARSLEPPEPLALLDLVNPERVQRVADGDEQDLLPVDQVGLRRVRDVADPRVPQRLAVHAIEATKLPLPSPVKSTLPADVSMPAPLPPPGGQA